MLMQQYAGKVLRIHPSFRLIATAEPPASKTTASRDDKDNKSSVAAKSTSDWLNSETLSLFLFHPLEALEARFERDILSKRFRLNEQHERLLELVGRVREASGDEAQLGHLSRLLSLRKVIRLARALEKHPGLSLVGQIEDACLLRFVIRQRALLNCAWSKGNKT